MTGPDRPWLSVLVPMFKVEACLDQCLGSITGQADAGVEIVICDDASPDGSAAIAQRYAARFPGMVRLIGHDRNRGIAATRNSLLDAARGDYLWFVDSDDWLRAGAIAAVAAVVQRDAPDLIGCDYRKQGLHRSAFADRHNRLLTDRDRIVAGICGSRKMYAWVRIVRRAIWDEALRFPAGRVFEDAAIMPRLALRARSYFHIGRPLVEYRVWQGSILAAVKSTRTAFDLPSHRDLACAMVGFTELLEREAEPFALTRFAVSHFIAMEFAKTAERIARAGRSGADAASVAPRVAEFRAMMEPTSPLAFPDLLGAYARRGRWVAWVRLRRAMARGRKPA